MPDWKKYFAEFIGTYALVFCGTGAVVMDAASGGMIENLGIAAAFGAVVMVMIFAVGAISGAHFNPAVTVGFWLAGLFPARKILPYVGAQCIAAILASLSLLLLFPATGTLGETMPAGSVMQSFVLEVIITFLLMFVIIQVATAAEPVASLAAIPIGVTVFLAALIAGPICGASMNPARSLGPALVAVDLQHLWLYLTAPFVGSAVAILCYRLLK